MEREKIKYVGEDLDYLRSGWGPDILEPDIRRGSSVLRRLLVEGVYGQAWRAMAFEHQPGVVAVDLEILIGKENFEKIVIAMALGANFRGMFMAAACINEGDKPIGEATPPIREGGFPGERYFTISDYLKSTSGIAGRIKVTRSDIIKYVANINGGVHLGRVTKRAEKDLVRKIAKFEKKISVNITDGILVELVAIAQAIGNSEDAQKLAEAIRVL